MARGKNSDDVLVKARRQESKAHNELKYCERQAKGQQLQLDGLLQYKDECVGGLETGKEMGLMPLHVRELKLLMTHINSEIDTVAYKVDVSQANYEKAKEVWQTKNESFEKVKELIKQKQAENKEQDDEKHEALNSDKANKKKYEWKYND